MTAPPAPLAPPQPIAPAAHRPRDPSPARPTTPVPTPPHLASFNCVLLAPLVLGLHLSGVESLARIAAPCNPTPCTPAPCNPA